jgi:IS30 family transposase
MRKERSDKITFDKKDISKIEYMAAMGLSLDQIASIFGISTDTIYRRVNEGNIDLSAALSRGKSKALYKIAKKAYKIALEGNPSMIKYFLSCRGGWSEKLQIIDNNQVSETQEKQRQMQLIVDAMTDEEIDEYKSHSDKMKQIVACARERVG